MYYNIKIHATYFNIDILGENLWREFDESKFNKAGHHNDIHIYFTYHGAI